MSMPMHIVAVGGLVTNQAGRILLVKSPRRGWEFPGGQVEEGESLTEALIREIREESGISVKVIGVVGTYSNISRNGNDGQPKPTVVNIDFICNYESGDLMTSEESIEVGWFTKDEAVKLVTYPILKERFSNMIDHDGSFHCSAFDRSMKFTEEYTFRLINYKIPNSSNKSF